MTAEIFTTFSILLICLILIIAVDALICGILKACAGIPFRKAFVKGCIALVIPPAVIAYGALAGRNMVKVAEVEISDKSLPSAFDGYRIVHISDIHARSFQGREKHLQKAVDKINSLDPDIVAFTGDLITMTPCELEGVKHILSGIKARDGVYSVLGNHDYCMYSDMDACSKEAALEELIRLEEEMGWTLLLNENRIITRTHDNNIAIIGVENTSPSRHFPSKGRLEEASVGTEGMFRIVLTHDPLHWESEIVGLDYPLTLSGHTHAMQFSLFGWSPSKYIFPQYRGLYSTEPAAEGDTEQPAEGDTVGIQQLHVNTGLGETIFPARIGVRPEITLITLNTEL